MGLQPNTRTFGGRLPPMVELWPSFARRVGPERLTLPRTVSMGRWPTSCTAINTSMPSPTTASTPSPVGSDVAGILPAGLVATPKPSSPPFRFVRDAPRRGACLLSEPSWPPSGCPGDAPSCDRRQLTATPGGSSTTSARASAPSRYAGCASIISTSSTPTARPRRTHRHSARVEDRVRRPCHRPLRPRRRHPPSTRRHQRRPARPSPTIPTPSAPRTRDLDRHPATSLPQQCSTPAALPGTAPGRHDRNATWRARRAAVG